MNATLRQQLEDKNKKLTDMVIERAKRDFPEDIALIGLSGSFRTGDFHAKSDLDLIIVNNTDRGWEISACFIFDDVGYDIYCTTWDSLERKANLATEDPGVSVLTDMQILYCAKPEYLERFQSLKQNAVDIMFTPIGKDCLDRAEKHINLAKQDYADMMLSNNIGAIRYASASLLYHLVNSIVNLNNTCIQRGVKRYFEELSAYQHLPENFEYLYMSVVEAKTAEQMKTASHAFLSGVIKLHDEMYQEYVEQPAPTYENLDGTYEEAWCNLRNKVLASVAAKDKSYALIVAESAQNYFDEMTADRGTKKFDLMQHFDPDNLETFQTAFLQVMDEYLQEYHKVGRSVERYETFEALYAAYMKQ